MINLFYAHLFKPFCHVRFNFKDLCQSIQGSRPDGTTLRCGVVYVTLTMGIFQRKGLFLIQSYRKHVSNGRSRIDRSGWRLGQPGGATLDVTGALLEEPISLQLPFKIILEASSTALGASVGLAWPSSFSGCWVRDFDGSLRTAIRTVFSGRNLNIHFSLIDYNYTESLRHKRQSDCKFLFTYKCVAVWTEFIHGSSGKVFFTTAAVSSTTLTDYSGKVPDTPCCPEPDHAYSLRLRSGSTRAPCSQSCIPWDISQKPVTKPGSQRAAKGRLQISSQQSEC
jgi:hypothetical protein